MAPQCPPGPRRAPGGARPCFGGRGADQHLRESGTRNRLPAPTRSPDPPAQAPGDARRRRGGRADGRGARPSRGPGGRLLLGVLLLGVLLLVAVVVLVLPVGLDGGATANGGESRGTLTRPSTIQPLPRKGFQRDTQHPSRAEPGSHCVLTLGHPPCRPRGSRRSGQARPFGAP